MKNLIFLIFLMVLFVSCKKEKMNEWNYVISNGWTGHQVYAGFIWGDDNGVLPSGFTRLLPETGVVSFGAKFVGGSISNPSPIPVQYKDDKILILISKNGETIFSGYLEPDSFNYAQDSSLTYHIRLQ